MQGQAFKYLDIQVAGTAASSSRQGDDRGARKTGYVINNGTYPAMSTEAILNASF
jgi:hypothetical protein